MKVSEKLMWRDMLTKMIHDGWIFSFVGSLSSIFLTTNFRFRMINTQQHAHDRIWTRDIVLQSTYVLPSNLIVLFFKEKTL